MVAERPPAAAPPLFAAALLLTAPAVAQEGNLSELALSLVNEARAEEGLPSLGQGVALAEAAEAHAEDMLARDYYGHVSPEGQTARDRYLDAGGSQWRLVAENIAQCTGCETPADADRVRAFQSGWMQSPGHRENILAPGLDRFGFGIASGDGRVYAVQMFAGPGTAPGAEPGVRAARVGNEELRSAALQAVNETRRDAGQSSLEMSADLNALARTLAERATLDGEELVLPGDTFGLLPEGASGWTGLAVSAEACGGCGAYPAEGDGAHFAPNLLPAGDPAAFTHMGFALWADGEGRKIAVGVFGQR